VANGSTTQAKHVTNLPFKQLSSQGTQAHSFANFPTSLMSVGKTADDETISIFTKDGVRTHNNQHVLITYKGEPLLVEIRDQHGRYCIPLLQQERQ
jgi:hypothetical protein